MSEEKTTQGDKQKATEGEKPWMPTRLQESLLMVILDPANRLKSVADLCALAECSRDVYFDAFKNSKFMEHYYAESIQLTRRAVAPVVNASVREAKRGNHNHTKIVLGMAGAYHERHELTGANGSPLGGVPAGTMPPLELANRIAAIIRAAQARKAEATNGSP